MRRPLHYCLVAAILTSLASVPTFGQEPNVEESTPRSAGQSFPWFGSGTDRNDETEATRDGQQGNSPLTGAMKPSLGSEQLRHSYWVPGFQSSTTIRSTSIDEPTRSDWNSMNYLLGNVSLHHAWGNADLSLNYSGGGYFSTDRGEGNGFLQLGGISQTFRGRKWQLTFLDEFSYLPQSFFGFGVGSGISLPGIGGSLAPALPGLQTNYQPSQSVFTSLGARYSNAFVTQAIYAVSRRGSIDFIGSRGTLRFVEPGNFDSDDTIFSIGYSYAVTRKDTVGVLYRYTSYQFPGNPQAFGDHVAHFAYGRTITGRLGLQLFVGPETTTFRLPIDGKDRHVGMSWGAALNRAAGINNLAFTYTHGLANGSGVQVGSRTDQVEASVTRQVSRNWQLSGNVGVARNGSLGTSAASFGSQDFDSYYFGVGLRRPVGRNASLLLGYSAQIQTSSQPICAAGFCSDSYTQHQITLGFSWHTSPFILR